MQLLRAFVPARSYAYYDATGKTVRCTRCPAWPTATKNAPGASARRHGIRRELTVDRDAPDGPVAEFTVEAGDVNVRGSRTLEVSFEYEGELCGLAWRDVQVVATQEPQPAPSQTSASGGTGVTLGLDAAPFPSAASPGRRNSNGSSTPARTSTGRLTVSRPTWRHRRLKHSPYS